VLPGSACSSSSPSSAASPLADGGSTDAASDDESALADGGSTDAPSDGASDGSATATNVRGQRYCEILLATVNGSTVHVDVYNTFGLNDCPDAQWTQVNATQVAQQEGVTQAILNGPRYWTLDEFVSATLVDPTPKTVGGIAMRLAGQIDFPTAQAQSLMKPYTQHQIQRKTTVLFAAGNPVFELVDPQGKIYDMQSYSTQKVMQTPADLANLGSKLTLPAGWSWRTRTLTQDLTITAVDGIGIVVQDDDDNTYQQSQQ
jgi:hypothetical protein